MNPKRKYKVIYNGESFVIETNQPLNQVIKRMKQPIYGKYCDIKQWILNHDFAIQLENF
jgi:hypothetical protein